ncbi:SRPBCC family protein [Ornithinimicrobium pekingense]|uniref:Activator of HSP90 ATPase n=1 Tax=Ornithinimicrobium pekingense TaxID=384677 RepID=A0ABQ2F3E8_9MICO|nr:SRPBCC domain-containing protein [Ornithinimicrobium pekingense]GGK55850.1 activator of HSP90 ATPase [Ornithinimicrobium pekingense]
MPVTAFTTDPDTLTLTITAQFAAPVERVWELYADPRQLEQVWGPPGYPATFVEHDLSAGGRMTYYMTAPDGERYGGWWQISEVDAPRRFTFEDGFADPDLRPLADMPVSHNVYSFEPADGGTRAVFTSTYSSAEALQQVLDMGVEEGATSAINQIDGFLAA